MDRAGLQGNGSNRRLDGALCCRYTLARGLTSGLDIERNTSGLPLRLLASNWGAASAYSIRNDDNVKFARKSLDGKPRTRSRLMHMWLPTFLLT